MDKLRVAKVNNVTIEDLNFIPSGSTPVAASQSRRTTGTLHLTPHHLIFSPSSSPELWIPYPSITYLNRLPQTLQGFYPLQIRTRTFESYILHFEKDQDRITEDVWQSVKDCAVVTTVEQVYAFYYSLPSSSTSLPNGWSAYNPRSEFSRQGLGTRTKAWRFTDVNKDYAFSPTYPSKLVVPSRISDSVLSHAGKYRSKGRIPALTYLHWANHASITRSSQPLVGLKNSRSAQDEKLVDCIFTSHTSPENAFVPVADALSPSISTADAPVYGATSTNLIIDARPTTNAMANVAMGAGTENMENYRGGKKAYLGIDNIHVMRSSLKTVTDSLREAETGGFVDRTLLRKSNWLRHISTIIDGALVIVRNVHLNASHVLIHCSDGWDRTAQLSAIAQICLDPYFRTIDGFKVLVEKDWLSFGHKFLDRCGHLSSEKIFTVDAPEDDSDEEPSGAQRAAQAFFASVQKQFTSSAHLKEVSPVFHQFLDCVRQVQRQYPDRFEFNEQWLLDIYYHLYSCQFGTFLFNNERSRRERTLGSSYLDKTASLWDFLDLERSQYINSDFDASLDDRDSRGSNADQGVIMPDARDVRFWFRLFKREDEEMNGTRVLAQAQGAEMLGPVGAGQDDPVSIEAFVSDSLPVPYRQRPRKPLPPGRNQLVTDPSPAASGSQSYSAPDESAKATQRRDQSGWHWSHLSSGALSAISGAARDLGKISQDAFQQIRAEAGEVKGEMWTRDDEREDEITTSAGVIGQSGLPGQSIPRTRTKMPLETNPWSVEPTQAGVPRIPSTPAIPTTTNKTTASNNDITNPWDKSHPVSLPTSLDELTLLDDRRAANIISRDTPTAKTNTAEEAAALGGDRRAWDPLGAL